jgi:hypothetical protein
MSLRRDPGCQRMTGGLHGDVRQYLSGYCAASLSTRSAGFDPPRAVDTQPIPY